MVFAGPALRLAARPSAGTPVPGRVPWALGDRERCAQHRPQPKPMLPVRGDGDLRSVDLGEVGPSSRFGHEQIEARGGRPQCPRALAFAAAVRAV